ncbi:FAD-dependent oxidoreductase [Panacibacter ginsenosidivorans]|uniref:Tryptophan 2-monooxygenase n=1 Tax=Panacibacter ginsenosidivorans TaxID=1813871 RepID=A0A5B8V8H4_9BACT|nr:NAD(P)/FAD-dependent oxidoreductase [Panacibacter ginsenosidivorans]QEC67840.1 FAD-dependent oxidoreductase [Panacibacter ginsenosidivorans]
MKYDVLIIGAGAAGLMAMRELIKSGYQVCILEATGIAGGRIHTIKENGFDDTVETGPEFIHGNLERTQQLVKEAGLSLIPVTGKMVSVQKGKWLTEDDEDEHWDVFMKRLQQQEDDITIEQFLQQYFSATQYASLRNAVQHYAEGFDLADISKASVLFVKEEWSQHNEVNYRIKGGYGKLIDYLQQQCMQQHDDIFFNHPVYKIEHYPGHVTAHTINNKTISASKLIVTVPLGVLQNNSIEFMPALASHSTAIAQLGFGTVIKILLQFKTAFWKKHADDIGFILSDETIPTWWTQSPIQNNLLTGWLGGPKAAMLSRLTNDALLQTALHSLSAIFHKSMPVLQQLLTHHKIICWSNNPYIQGGYSYNTIASAEAKNILATPVNNTIFFAGEAYYTGKSQGTVEAALQSGREAAGKLRAFI